MPDTPPAVSERNPSRGKSMSVPPLPSGTAIRSLALMRTVSGTTDNRPDFQKMIKDSHRKLFDLVIVWKLDRFARNRYDSALHFWQRKKNGFLGFPVKWSHREASYFIVTPTKKLRNNVLFYRLLRKSAL